MSPVHGRSRLGSLVGAARRLQMEQIGYARTTLLCVGFLFVLLGLLGLASLGEHFDEMLRQKLGNVALDAGTVEFYRKAALVVALGIIGMGVLNLVFAALVDRFPLPVTIIALVTFLGFLVIHGVADPHSVFPSSVLGFLFLGIRIILLIALMVSFHKAIAAEAAWQAEEEEPDEDDEPPGRP